MIKDEMKDRISMALKDPILQQGFEIICKNLDELEKENTELEKYIQKKKFIIDQLNVQLAEFEKENAELNKKLSEAEADYDKMFWSKNEIISKAKELLNEFMRISKASDEDFEHDYTELIGEAELFLKEVSE